MNKVATKNEFTLTQPEISSNTTSPTPTSCVHTTLEPMHQSQKCQTLQPSDCLARRGQPRYACHGIWAKQLPNLHRYRSLSLPLQWCQPFHLIEPHSTDDNQWYRQWIGSERSGNNKIVSAGWQRKWGRTDCEECLLVLDTPMCLLCPHQIAQQTNKTGDGIHALGQHRILTFDGYQLMIHYHCQNWLPIIHLACLHKNFLRDQATLTADLEMDGSQPTTSHMSNECCWNWTIA